MFFRLLITLLFCTFILPLSVSAEEKKPIEITAAGSLEWDRDKRFYVARKDAIAKRESSQIQADMLKALYKEPEDGDTEIYQFEAIGNVRITLNNGEQKIFGDKAIYNLDKEEAVITGKDLKLITEEQIVTAQKSLEYNVKQKQMRANGDAKATQNDDSLSAETLIAHLRTNDAGDDEIYKLEAIKNVVIQTPTETAKGKRGTYELDKDLAELTGGVTIIRGPNTLLGERAQVDLETNISTIFSGDKSPTGNGRVRAVFFPDTLNKDETN